MVSAAFELADLHLDGQALPARQSKHHSNPQISGEELAGLRLSLHTTCDFDGRCDANSGGTEPHSLHQLEDPSALKWETLVMKSHAYFQLRTRPGLSWLRVDGHIKMPRSQFAIEALDGWDKSVALPTSVPLVTNSLVGVSLKLRVVRLSNDSEASERQELTTRLPFYSIGNADWMEQSSARCVEPIHIFTLASGKMYERLSRTMIASVRRHTQCPLNFWLLDIFLSPNFKKVAEEISKRYTFNCCFPTDGFNNCFNSLRFDVKFHFVAYKVSFCDGRN